MDNADFKAQLIFALEERISELTESWKLGNEDFDTQVRVQQLQEIVDIAKDITIEDGGIDYDYNQ